MNMIHFKKLTRWIVFSIVTDIFCLSIISAYFSFSWLVFLYFFLSPVKLEGNPARGLAVCQWGTTGSSSATTWSSHRWFSGSLGRGGEDRTHFHCYTVSARTHTCTHTGICIHDLAKKCNSSSTKWQWLRLGHQSQNILRRFSFWYWKFVVACLVNKSFRITTS